MKNRNGQKWTREEIILAYELYCITPFRKISKSNKTIIELAKLLGRTPSSVGLKMANLAHYDPELASQNISAMSHGSKLDLTVFKEFENDLGKLADCASLIKDKLKIEEKENDTGNIHNSIPEGNERAVLTKARVGQDFFRDTILVSYKNRCCVTGINEPVLLIASHIKPWKDSDENKEKTNPKNGLCLNALHDKAFDRGLITVTTNYQIMISNKLKSVAMDEITKDWISSYEEKRIELPEKFSPSKEFIEYHNDVVFLR